jgi:peptidoglycan/xylan/chitin deacetylase (PgdA/CDA1 family)
MIIAVITGILVIVCLAWLTLFYSFLVPPKKGLPILMYHKVSENRSDGLTITTGNLDKQFFYLREKGYKTISFKELISLISAGQRPPKKTVILTFDDAYESFAVHAMPLLAKYNFKATVFIPVGYMGKTNAWDEGAERILSPDELKVLANTGDVEFGLHSFLHRSYGDLAVEDMKDDLESCISTLGFYAIPFVRVLAYPYGGYPKKDKRQKEAMKELFREYRLSYALRIGNRINPLPLKDPYELTRIDMKGTDSFTTFRIKIRKGRKKLFS